MTLDDLIAGLASRGFENPSLLMNAGHAHFDERHFILFTDGLVIYSNGPFWRECANSSQGLVETWDLKDFSWAELDFIMS